MTTLDYDGESAAPRPVSETVEKYLKKSISLSDILHRVLRGWLFAVIGVLLGLATGIFTVWITPPSYTISITLLPLEAGSADIGGGGATGLGALSGLLGTTGPVPKFTRFVTAFYTTGLAKALDKKYDTNCRMTPACNKKTRQWARRTGFVAWIDRMVAQIAHLPDPDAPHTAGDLAKYIGANVVISSDVNSRMLSLSMDSRDPNQAQVFLLNLVEVANDYIKDQDNANIKKEVAYITSQLQTNTNVDQRTALTTMLASEENHLMLTAVDLPYVAEIQDGPNVEISNSAIKYIAAYSLLGLLAGGAFGIALTFLPKRKRFSRK